MRPAAQVLGREPRTFEQTAHDLQVQRLARVGRADDSDLPVGHLESGSMHDLECRERLERLRHRPKVRWTLGIATREQPRSTVKHDGGNPLVPQSTCLQYLLDYQMYIQTHQLKAWSFFHIQYSLVLLDETHLQELELDYETYVMMLENRVAKV